ncbi:MAG: prepilin-type N-terminal cleavage/methylation domain-containing protein [Roseiarcus sp.]|jgi:general secretion pathway protein H
MRDEAGFTLIEVACVLAVVALVATLALPALPRGTSSARLEGYALQIAALLKSDRIAAIRRGTPVATWLDADARTVRSGASGAIVALPSDVSFDALLAERCGDRRVGSSIDFFPSGESCGGTIAVARQGLGFQVRVNWLTGAVEVVSAAKS